MVIVGETGSGKTTQVRGEGGSHWLFVVRALHPSFLPTDTSTIYLPEAVTSISPWLLRQSPVYHLGYRGSHQYIAMVTEAVTNIPPWLLRQSPIYHLGYRGSHQYIALVTEGVTNISPWLPRQSPWLPIWKPGDLDTGLTSECCVLCLIQIPQYLHEAGWTANGYTVGITQPRRVAATTVRSLLTSHSMVSPVSLFVAAGCIQSGR